MFSEPVGVPLNRLRQADQGFPELYSKCLVPSVNGVCGKVYI